MSLLFILVLYFFVFKQAFTRFTDTENNAEIESPDSVESENEEQKVNVSDYFGFILYGQIMQCNPA